MLRTVPRLVAASRVRRPGRHVCAKRRRTVRRVAVVHKPGGEMRPRQHLPVRIARNLVRGNLDPDAREVRDDPPVAVVAPVEYTLEEILERGI